MLREGAVACVEGLPCRLGTGGFLRSFRVYLGSGIGANGYETAKAVRLIRL